MINKQTQAERLFKFCRRKAMTYMDLLMTGISTAPHKRLAEGEKYLAGRGEMLVRGKNKKGLRTFRVIKATSWTA